MSSSVRTTLRGANAAHPPEERTISRPTTQITRSAAPAKAGSKYSFQSIFSAGGVVAAAGCRLLAAAADVLLPANNSLEIGWVNDELDRSLELAEEKEFKTLFDDCELGAVPALGDAYGIQVIWDDELQYTADIYIEAGDHEHLIWLDRKDFKKLMLALPHSIISKDAEVGCWKY